MVNKLFYSSIVVSLFLGGCAFHSIDDAELEFSAITYIVEPKFQEYLYNQYGYSNNYNYKSFHLFSDDVTENIYFDKIIKQCYPTANFKDYDLIEDENYSPMKSVTYSLSPAISSQNKLKNYFTCLESNFKQTKLSIEGLTSLKNDKYYQEYKNNQDVNKMLIAVKKQNFISIQDALNIYKKVMQKQEADKNKTEAKKYSSELSGL